MSVQLSPPQQTTSPPPPNPGPPTMPTPPFGTLVAPSSPNTPPTMATPPGSVGSGTHPLEHFRLQQLYTLALADRMRFLNPLWAAPRPLIPGGPPGAPHVGTGPELPPGFCPTSAYKSMADPRFFGRGPDEPKPQQSYIGLIAMAILSHADEKLVLADIYQYILDNFPYFRHRGPGWRNSIRHNLSLNDCFIKAGRAANGKGHYWAIHQACIDDFKKGDFRRRKAQRKVRRHMGLAVDEEDSPSPPPPPPQGLLGPHGWPPLPLRLPPPPHLTLNALNAAAPHLGPPPPAHPLHHHGHHHAALPLTPITPPVINTTSITPPNSVPPPPTSLLTTGSTSIRVKRQFDVASLLASENNKKEEDIVEVGNNNNDSEETRSEANNDEENSSWRSVSPQGPSTQNHHLSNNLQPQLMPHQYLARYYQLVQQQNSAAAAAALAAAAAAAASSAASEKFNQHHHQTTSPRVSPHTPDRAY